MEKPWKWHKYVNINLLIEYSVGYSLIRSCFKVWPDINKYWNYIFICPSLRRDVLWYTNVRLSVRPFHMSRSNLKAPWPIHFKFHRVIGIDGLTVCILYGEISNFHSRVMGLYSSNYRRFFVCRTVNWEPPGQFTSNFAQLLELIVLRSVYFLVKFQFFIPELWDFIHQIVGDFSYVTL